METTTKKTTSNASNLRGLYAITPCSSIQPFKTVELVDQVCQALEGGARIIQYREKQHSDNIREQQAKLLKTVCTDYDACLLINDDIELALSVNADGVHLGRDDLPLPQARSLLGEHAIIGISCYNQLALATQAQQQGANYVAFGRFFPSTTKPDAVPADMSLLAQAKSALSIPVACIGGITLDNAKLLVSAGADMVAVIESLFGTSNGVSNTTQTAKAFTQLFD